jgi:hypothetical protein
MDLVAEVVAEIQLCRGATYSSGVDNFVLHINDLDAVIHFKGLPGFQMGVTAPSDRGRIARPLPASCIRVIPTGQDRSLPTNGPRDGRECFLLLALSGV